MGQKNKNRNRSIAQEEISIWDQIANAKVQMGMEQKTEKPKEEEVNPYKDYDPEKNRSNDKKQNNQNSHRNAENRRNEYGAKSGNKQNVKGNEVVHRISRFDQTPHAPYNFVSYDHWVMEAGKIPARNSIAHNGLYTGYIAYTMTAQTPILVDDGKDGFYCNKDGRYAVPGSTMRGLIRNNLQILSFSDFKDDIDDYSLMYRAVAGGCLKDEYNRVLGSKPESVNGHQITVLKNVRAGYIGCKGKEYFLYRNIGDTDHSFKQNEADYYVVSERYVLEHARKNFECLLDCFQNRGPFEKSVDYHNRVHYRDRGRKTEYTPYYKRIAYELSNNRVCKIKEAGLARKGYVISSGKMQEKKVFYVIPEMDPNDEGRRIPEASITAFQADYNSRDNTINGEKAREFYQLPKDGEIRPVFYIDYEGMLYFGYTPRLRLMYRHTIAEGLKQETVSCDYAKAIFGYSNGEASLKSRVYFQDAILSDYKGQGQTQKLILAEPKPTSYLDYLKQSDGKKVATYNDDSFELRGIKQYWLHEEVEKPEGMNQNNEKIYSTISPLAADSQFRGTVRFQNLTEEELGVLIRSIRLEKDSQMNVGKAKAYGYGRVKFDGIKLFLQNPGKAYVADSAVFGVNVYEEKTEQQRDAFADKYLCALAKWLGVSGKEAVYKNPSIKDFFEMKSYLAKGRTVAYMSLQNPSGKGNGRDQTQDGYAEYKQNNNPLPTVSDITSRNK